MKPLHFHLKFKYYAQFESGLKKAEIRRHGKQYNGDTCPVGRKVVLHKGYGNERLTGKISAYSRVHGRRLSPDEQAAVKAIYKTLDMSFAYIGIEIDGVEAKTYGPGTDIFLRICNGCSQPHLIRVELEHGKSQLKLTPVLCEQVGKLIIENPDIKRAEVVKLSREFKYPSVIMPVEQLAVLKCHEDVKVVFFKAVKHDGYKISMYRIHESKMGGIYTVYTKEKGEC